MSAKGEEFLNHHLMENLHDDPYGTSTYVIRRLLETVLDDGVSGIMSETEFQQLSALAMSFVETTGINLDSLGPR